MKSINDMSAYRSVNEAIGKNRNNQSRRGIKPSVNAKNRLNKKTWACVDGEMRAASCRREAGRGRRPRKTAGDSEAEVA